MNVSAIQVHDFSDLSFAVEDFLRKKIVILRIRLISHAWENKRSRTLTKSS